MSLSLAAESRHKGLYETQFWTRASSSTGPTLQCLAPLLFPEPLPAISFINRGDVLRVRADGGPAPAQLNVHELQFLRKASGNPRLSLSSTRGKESFSLAELGGTVIPLFNGELLCLVQPGGSERSLSRPSSRAHSRPPGSRPPSGIIENGVVSEKPIGRQPSIRVKSGASSGLDRKASLARRNSLPTLSQRSSVVISEHPPDSVVRVVVQAGTMERLVEVLAHGLPGITVSIADDNGEMPLREGKQREIRMDKTEFSLVWWKVFRSFITPANFFEVQLTFIYSSSYTEQFTLVSRPFRNDLRRPEVTPSTSSKLLLFVKRSWKSLVTGCRMVEAHKTSWTTQHFTMLSSPS